MRRASFLPIVFLVLECCIDSYEVPDNIFVGGLVVDGMITNGPGPHIVKLFNARNPALPLECIYMIESATVSIHDDAGDEIHLKQISPGVYATDSAVRGVIGRKYTLRISYGENHYRTEPQLLDDAGGIDSLYYVFRNGVLYNKREPWEAHHAIDIYASGHAAENSSGLLRWRWTSTHELKTNPELRIKIEPGECPPFTLFCEPIITPIPMECSGWALPGKPGIMFGSQRGPRGIRFFKPCECCVCYLTEKNPNAIVSQNRIVDGRSFNHTFIARLPVENERFNIRFRLQLDQLSVNDEQYAFWSLVKGQVDANGSLFQPNIITIKGNIINENPAGPAALGNFSVSGIVSRVLWISPRELPVVLYPPDTIRTSCTAQYKGAVYEKPSFW